MEADLLAQILQELHEIKTDLRWFKEREELKQWAVREMTEDAVRQLIGNDAENATLTTKDRAKALAAFVKKTESEK